jgi:alkanesulfonate monooxygenase SsuD/methylene tetrahydromethanopterin reductase-like flavin-dependent oxidoreductase (luciferase family)
MALAIIGGAPERFVPMVDLYRESGLHAGHDASVLKVSINSHGFVADTSQQAADAFYPGYAETMTRIGRERGWPPTSRQQFDAARSRGGSLLVGSVDEVTEKILREHSLFAHDRFLMQYSVGAMPHAHALRGIEMLGTKVAPAVRAALGVRRPGS